MKNFLLGLAPALLVPIAFARSGPDSRPAWEYKVIAFETMETDSASALDAKYADVQTKRDELGKVGWKLQSAREPKISASDLASDLAVMRTALEALHPGLTLHQSREEYDRSWARLSRKWAKPIELRQAYLALSEHLAGIRCGHTYANFWNQPEAVKTAVIDRSDKLPFTFKIVEGRMLVTAGKEVPKGAQVTTIGNRRVADILRHLLKLTKGDGGNDANRLAQLEVSGLGKHEAFDVYFPLIQAPEEGSYRVTFTRPGIRSEPETFRVKAVSRAERQRNLGLTEAAPWEASMLPGGVGYLRLSTFTTWNFKFEWRKFLDEAFDKFRTEAPNGLAIDLRGNEGGDDSVIQALARKLLAKDAAVRQGQSYVRFDKVPDDLRPYLETWNPANFDLSKDVGPQRADGLYPLKSRAAGEVPYRAVPGAYPGKVWLLVGPSNSSATFYTARLFKSAGLATLVGRTTGGSQRGMQGGQFFILRLPKTGLAVDIPLIAVRSEPPLPDAGLEPDVMVRWRFADARRGIDPDLAAVSRLAARSVTHRASGFVATA